jgi:hypothetical protein
MNKEKKNGRKKSIRQNFNKFLSLANDDSRFFVDVVVDDGSACGGLTIGGFC